MTPSAAAIAPTAGPVTQEAQEAQGAQQAQDAQQAHPKDVAAAAAPELFEPAAPEPSHAFEPAARRKASERPDARGRALLVALVLIWAVSWPVIKIGVATMPPIWFACQRYAIAAACAFVFVAMRGSLRVPAAADWRFVLVSGVLQMGAYAALTAAALTRLPPGRASVLAYSTPLWVVPLSAWWLRERITRRGLSGVVLGLTGVVIIASPALRQGVGPWQWQQLEPYALLLGAAAAWAVTIVYVRAHRFQASTAALAPWQMLVAALMLWPLAMALDGHLPPVTIGAAAALCYVSPIATAFAYWAAVEVGRSVRATTMSMTLLVVPALGALLSSIVLHEMITPSLVLGLLFIVTGIRATHPRDAASPRIRATPPR
jgi:O-acetylserine/cysteine efflux transporter